MSPADRRARERTIVDTVRDRVIRTQSDLVGALRERGFDVTQATVSRDIRRLGIVKLRDPQGRLRYLPGEAERPAPVARRALATALREFATDLVTGDALLAVRTQSGCANAVAVAIDDAALDGVVATLAGDDTIFVLLADAEERSRVLEELEALAAS